MVMGKVIAAMYRLSRFATAGANCVIEKTTFQQDNGAIKGGTQRSMSRQTGQVRVAASTFIHNLSTRARHVNHAICPTHCI